VVVGPEGKRKSSRQSESSSFVSGACGLLSKIP